MVEWIRALLLVYLRIPVEMALPLAVAIAVTLVVLLAVLANVAARMLLLGLVRSVVARTATNYDDAFLNARLFDRLAQLAPAIVLYLMLPALYRQSAAWVSVANDGVLIYMVVIGALVIDSVIDAVETIYSRFAMAREIPIRGFVQIAKVVVYFLALILVIAIIIDQSPVVLISGLGAFSAVLLLVFRDSILGFVAGVQLTANKMLAKGDWIEMPRFNADGDVIDITLTTVKVQNWDKTITTIPTYSLITDSFKNWRGMSESGGRRIKRAVNIDMNTVRFASADLLDRLERELDLGAALAELRRDAGVADNAGLAASRSLTNLGVYRAYLEAYLRRHPEVKRDMTFLVRALAPGPEGVPVEIYVFSADQVWVNYEAIQGAIVDHMLAVLPEFGLAPFQHPSGNDMARLAGTSATPTAS